MPVEKDKATIKGGGELTPVKIKIEDVNSCDEVKETEMFTIKFPFRIRFVDEQGNIVGDNRTQGSLKALDRTTKFYINKKSGYQTFTRDQDLLAVMWILEATGHKLYTKYLESGELDINELIGIEFEAVLAANNKFIDWYQTFQHNKVWAPEQDQGAINKAKAEQKAADEALDTTIDKEVKKPEPKPEPETPGTKDNRTDFTQEKLPWEE